MWARAGNSAAQAARGAALIANETNFDPARLETVGAGAYRACFMPARKAEGLAGPWREVIAEGLVRDPFLHPFWLAAAARHNAGLRDLQLLTLWRGARLCGLFPLLHENRLIRRNWRIPRLAGAADGAPFLLDAEAASLFAAASRLLHRRAPMLHVDLSRNATPFIRLAMPQMTPRDAIRTEALLTACGATTAPARTQHETAGNLQFRFSSEASFVRAGVEHLLDCDARAAAIAGRAPLLRDVGTINTIRAATRAMAGDKSCRVALLNVDGIVRAAAIVLFAHDRAVIWHEANDPACPAAAWQLHQRLVPALGRLRNAPVLTRATPDLTGTAPLRIALTAGHDLPDDGEHHRPVHRDPVWENRYSAQRIRNGNHGGTGRVTAQVQVTQERAKIRA